MKNVLQSVKGYFDERKEKKESERQMKLDLEMFWRYFDEISLDEKQGILEVADFLTEDGGVVNNSPSNPKVKEMIDILLALPRKELFITYNLLREKVKTQEALMSALLPDTEYEDAPEDENEHAFGSGVE